MLNKLRRRSAAECRSLLDAIVVHAVVAAAVRMLPYGRACAWLRSTIRPRLRTLDAATAERRVVWSVKTATALLPIGTTCLTEALTAHLLLGRSGYDSTVQFGVRATPTACVSAHAWLEREGRTLVGASTPAEYVPLAPVFLTRGHE